MSGEALTCGLVAVEAERLNDGAAHGVVGVGLVETVFGHPAGLLVAEDGAVFRADASAEGSGGCLCGAGDVVHT